MNNFWKRLTDWERSPVFQEIRERKIKRLVGILKHKNILAREEANEDLIKLGEAVIPALILNLGDQSRVVRERASIVLLKMGEPAVPGLVEALGHEELLNRMAAARVLADMAATCPNPRMREKFPALIDVLGSQNFIVRNLIANALIEIGPLGRKDLKLLEQNAQRAGREGKPTTTFAKVHIEWSRALSKRAGEHLAKKRFPVPRQAQADSVKRVSRVERVIA